MRPKNAFLKSGAQNEAEIGPYFQRCTFEHCNINYNNFAIYDDREQNSPHGLYIHEIQ